MKQLNLFGDDPNFGERSVHRLIDEIFVQAIREELKRPSRLFLASPYAPRPYYEQERLIEPPPQCDIYMELGDDWLDCHLDAGHDGPHYDAQQRVEWSAR